jgi:hypothetical protein
LHDETVLLIKFDGISAVSMHVHVYLFDREVLLRLLENIVDELRPSGATTVRGEDTKAHDIEATVIRLRLMRRINRCVDNLGMRGVIQLLASGHCTNERLSIVSQSNELVVTRPCAHKVLIKAI